jgi:hypothetical protein
MALLSAFCLGVFLLKPQIDSIRIVEKPNLWRFGLMAVFVLILLYDVLERITPPTDADTLTYNFALPKLFLKWGADTYLSDD